MISQADPVVPSAGQRRLAWSVALAGGLAAAVAAGAGMWTLRLLLAVRTLPERLLDWLLLFVPLDLFEAGLQRFGFDAKRYAFLGVVAVLLAVLGTLGAVALRRGWSGRALVGLAVGLWAFTMVVLLPLTGAGFFGLELIQGTGGVVLGHLAVALSYAATLAAARGVLAAATGAPSQRSWPTATLLAGAAAVAFGVTPRVADWGPRPSLPLAVVSPAQPVTPAASGTTPSPRSATAPMPLPRPEGTPTPLPSPTTSPVASPTPSPEPTRAPDLPWNTTNLDPATNGNVERAVALIATRGAPTDQRLATQTTGTPPWEQIGDASKFSGVVGRVRDATEEEPERQWSVDGRLTEVVLYDSPEAGTMPVACLIPSGGESIREGDHATIAGYLVGLTDVENPSGGTTTGLLVVGVPLD